MSENCGTIYGTFYNDKINENLFKCFKNEKSTYLAITTSDVSNR